MPCTRTLRLAGRRLAAVALALGVLVSGAAPASPAQAGNRVTPGNFTGYGFDQCTAPTQRAMDAWLTGSSYWAVGIYISGASRGCTSQPNLTPTWVRTQLAHHWRLLPITLGPQAWCTTRERYLHQVRINPSSRYSYAKARAQGRAEATKTVGVGRRLGISRGSTLWYDLEAFSITRTDCRKSALSFLSAWTKKLHHLHYVSGVYSSAASGITMLDNARANRPGSYAMPNRVWIADWNGRANTSSSYVRQAGWQPHRRVHQYRGGHYERHGGVTIDIDQNWLDLGQGSTTSREIAHCRGAASYDYGSYASRSVGDRGALVRTVQCLLRNKSGYDGAADGVYDAELGAAVRSYRVSRGLPADTVTGPRTWVALLSQGEGPVLKYGSAGEAVRRVQRAVNAADHAGVRVTGIFGAATTTAVKRYQHAHGRARTGVVGPRLWRTLRAGTI